MLGDSTIPPVQVGTWGARLSLTAQTAPSQPWGAQGGQEQPLKWCFGNFGTERRGQRDAPQVGSISDLDEEDGSDEGKAGKK